MATRLYSTAELLFASPVATPAVSAPLAMDLKLNNGLRAVAPYDVRLRPLTLGGEILSCPEDDTARVIRQGVWLEPASDPTGKPTRRAVVCGVGVARWDAHRRLVLRCERPPDLAGVVAIVELRSGDTVESVQPRWRGTLPAGGAHYQIGRAHV